MNFPSKSYNRKKWVESIPSKAFFLSGTHHPLYLLLWFLASHLSRLMPSDCVSLSCQLWQYSGLPGWLLKQLLWKSISKSGFFYYSIPEISHVFLCHLNYSRPGVSRYPLSLFSGEINSILCWEPIHQFRTCVDSVRF